MRCLLCLKPNNILRIKIPFAVAYGSKPEMVRKVVLKPLLKVENVLPEPKPFVRFEEMGEYSLDFVLVFYIDDYNKRFAAKTEVLKAVYKELNRAGIQIPYPTRTLYFGDDQKKAGKKRIRKKAVKK